MASERPRATEMASGLATRCSACGTVFRVVPDQLRVSEGWVRCGRCAEVFNAAEALLDLETGAPRRLPEDTFAARAPASSPTEPTAYGQQRASYHESDFDDARFDEAEAEAPPMPVVDDSASRFIAAVDDAPESTVQEGSSTSPLTSPVTEPRTEPDDRPPPAPSFVRQAEREARWRSRPVRAALLLLVLLGIFGLVAQVLFAYRDLAAARHAGLKPLLQQGCAWLDCEIGAARSINELTVESSGLVRVEKSSVYRLAVSLRNRAAIELALPALELSLTDANGQLVARRVLNAAELGVNQATLGAGRELQLQATLQATTAPVAGYTIELFYP